MLLNGMTLYHKISTLSKLIKLFTKIAIRIPMFFFFLSFCFDYFSEEWDKISSLKKFCAFFKKEEWRRRNYAITYIKTYSKDSLIKTVLA